MSRLLQAVLLHAPEPVPGARVLEWAEVEALARQLPAKSNLVVPKRVLSADPPHPSTRMGRSRGALRQFRCVNRRGNLHIKEFERHWIVHVDTWNPLRHPFRHLMVDHGFSKFLHLHEFLATAALVAPAPVTAQTQP